jgi:hypothetical protein
MSRNHTPSADPSVSGLRSEPDDAWRQALLTSLRDCGVQRAQRHRALQQVVTAFVICFVPLFSGFCLTRINERLAHAPVVIRLVAASVWVAFSLCVLAPLRNWSIRREAQTCARSAEEELERNGTRRPIFYLRSFRLDEKSAHRSWRERFLGTMPIETAEQTLAAVLRKLGPFIAMGRPGESLPTLGAARFYVSDDRWQEKVADVVKASQLVVWTTGVTEGLRWELDHLIRNVSPERLVLWAHPHVLRIGAVEREEEWARFRATLGPLFPRPLPELLGDTRFITFRPGWQPGAIAPPRHNLIWAIRSALNPQRSALRGFVMGQQGRLKEGTLR